MVATERELAYISTTEAAVFRTRELSPVELVEVYLERIEALLRDFDLLITPTTPKTAPTFGQSYAETFRRGPSYAGVYNMTGLPLLSVPCGFDSNGLPIGLPIGGRPFAEAAVLQAGHAYEQASGWYRRHPAI
jgi:Asp-tRNA(Asn)/Glu-tRNA(Gln) amidotransferase A subunit family amidase